MPVQYNTYHTRQHLNNGVVQSEGCLLVSLPPHHLHQHRHPLVLHLTLPSQDSPQVCCGYVRVKGWFNGVTTYVLQAAAGRRAVKGTRGGGVGGELDQVAAVPW